MKQDMLRHALLGLAVTLAGPSLSEPIPGEQESSAARFLFPSDPEFIVIQYQYGYNDGTPPLRVSGDGTVRAYQRWASYSPAPTLDQRILIPAGTHTADMPLDEVNELVRQLLNTGLLEFDEDQVQEQLKEARRAEFEATGVGYSTSTVGVHQIHLRFQDFRFSPEAEPIEDYKIKVAWRERDLNLERAVELYPEIPDLERFLEAVTILQDLHRETIRSAASQSGVPRPSEVEVETQSSAGPAGTDLVVLFAPESHQIDDAGAATLRWLASTLTESERSICLWLVGECDPATDGAICSPLADLRTREVEEFLFNSGLDPRRVSPLPPGGTHPPCDHASCSESLRRVVIISPGIADDCSKIGL